ncbi:MAG: TolC family protein [Nitrospirota bacterium]|nr:TolC family protein [Nitrospirota bacterium]MDP3598478.1 TolC family protein [Nitrospirota bacterium]
MGGPVVRNTTPVKYLSSPWREQTASLVCWLIIALVHPALGSAEPPPRDDYRSAASAPQKLSIEEAMALFSRNSFVLLRARYGVDDARAQQITAGLFPNPVLSVGLFSSFTQGCTAGRCGGVMPQVGQLFLVAGKRGFRMESAELGAWASEALFEDTVRTLSLSVNDSYYRVQVEREHLRVDRKIRDQLAGIIAGATPLLRPIPNERQKIRLELLLAKSEHQLIKHEREVENGLSDLRVLLALPPDFQLDLTTPLLYRPYHPDIETLRLQVGDRRPDVKAKRLLRAKRERELKLATALAYPDVTVGAGVMLQGPTGPDNQQQWAAGLSVPLPLFNRNQGGIAQATIGVESGEAEYRRALNQALNELDLAYHRLIQTRRLIETYNAGVLDRSLTLLDRTKKAYETNEVNILELVDAFRTTSETKDDYLDALYGHQRAVLNLESAAGQSLKR